MILCGISANDLSNCAYSAPLIQPEPLPDFQSGQAGQHGGCVNNTRLFLNAIRYFAKTGNAWTDIPTSYGKPKSL